ncbi:tubulin-like doman-containing protein [Azospirillum doebereinerae]|uniref:tubulin-like doman-containing protein n=1 Tax=Azospirillum doebereinerae TaxID=92933 RepID=UPI001EE50B19|nr:tubulin-like doman-containing protein [Azospirillum doebereinerae]MCG5238745.1 tubulin-like doman-containing protein [Azospirillum doebereinerae]
MSPIDSRPASDKTYGPALFIGLGGTGVRTLRFMRWLATSGGDTALAAAMRDNLIQLLAFDIDSTSDDEAQIDTHVLPTPSGGQDGWSAQTRRLPRLEKAFQFIPTEGVGNTLNTLLQTGHNRAREVKDKGTWAYFDWLPEADQETLGLLGSGQKGTKGASQRRPLGRIGLCNEVKEILEKLKTAAQKVAFSLDEGVETNKTLNVHLVCSLAGGTGAGMFWDIAFLLRDFVPNCSISASFLLAEPFVNTSASGRVLPNCYAALKELKAYKNWSIPPTERLSVLYQLGPNGYSLDRTAGAPSAFDNVFLYGAFKPAGGTSNDANITTTLTDTSCLRMAETLVAQRRRDVRRVLDSSGRNADTDSDSLKSERAREYVFSTASVIRLDLGDPDRVTRGLQAALFRRFQERAGGNLTPFVSRAALLSQLSVHWDPEGKRVRQEPTLFKAWIAHVKASREDMQRASLIRQEQIIARIREEAPGLRELDHAPAERMDKARRLYDLLDEEIRNAWRAELQARVGAGPSDAPRGVTRVMLFEKDLKVHWLHFTKALDALATTVKESLMLLDPRAERWARDTVKELEEWPETEDAAGQARIMDMPPSLFQMRVELGLYTEAESGVLRRLQERWRGGPIDAMFKGLCNAVAVTLDQHKPGALPDHVLEDAGWESMVSGFVRRNRRPVADALHHLLSVHEHNLGLLRERGQRIEDAAVAAVGSAYFQADHIHQVTSEALAPLIGELLGTRRPLSTNPERRKLLGNGLAEIAKRRAGRWAKAWGPTDGESILAADRERWGEFLVLLERHLRVDKADDATEDAAETLPARSSLAERLAVAFDEHWLGSAKPDVLRHEPSFDNALRAIHLLPDTFSAYWLEQPAFLLRRLGGAKGVADLIKRCRSTVFEPSKDLKSIQLDRLVIALPRIDDTAGPTHANAVEAELRTAFTQAATSIMKCDPIFTDTSSKLPLIYFEELYHSGQSIAGIETYDKHYRQIPLAQRPLLHFHRGADLLDGLVPTGGSQVAVLCGNDGCTYNLAGQTGLLHCPKCHGPLLNRCGNPGCEADDLRTQLNPPVPGKDGTAEPSHCPHPDCHRRLLTYWWQCQHPEHCEDAQHRPLWQPTTDNECRFCMEEYRAGTRPYLDVCRCNDKAPLPCPGCLAVGKEDRRMVPSNLIGLFRDGLHPSHAKRIAEALRTAKPPLLIDECLQKTGAPHMMFPTLTFERNGRLLRRSVHRNGAVFRNDEAAVSTRHTCFHCAHPIHVPPSRLRLTEPIGCPRCLRQLHECVYCSPKDSVLFQPLRPEGGEPRCPRCTNLFVRELQAFHIDADKGLERPAFCVNLFACRAGSRPWGTSSELSRGHCRCCDDAQAGVRFRLRPRKDLQASLDRCPICRILLGSVEDEAIVRDSAGGTLEHFAKYPSEALEETCEICATHPIAVLKWMVKTGYFDAAARSKAEERSASTRFESMAKGNYNIPAIPAAQGIEILMSIKDEPDDRQLYELVDRHITQANRLSRSEWTLVEVRADLARLFVGRSPNAHVPIARLETLIDIHRTWHEGRQPASSDTPF